MASGEFRDLADVREQAQCWFLDVAGLRLHGTIRKRLLAVLQDEERHILLAWDGKPYDVGDWRTAKVHPDHPIQCRQSLYSVPSGLCPPGQEVEVRMGSKPVRIYDPSTGSGRPADQDPSKPVAGSAGTFRPATTGQHGAAATGGCGDCRYRP